MKVAEPTLQCDPILRPLATHRQPADQRALHPDLSGSLASWLSTNRPRHLRYLRSRLPSTEDAEDVLQSATLMFLRHANRLETIGKVENWVGKSLRNAVVDRYRQMAAHKRLLESLSTAAPHSDEPATVDGLAAPIECIQATLATLRPAYGKLLAQVYFQGLSLVEAAAQLQLTSNNATVRLHRARAALRESMEAKCSKCSIDDCWARRRAQS